MATFVTVIHVVVCFFLILVVLLQAGKGGGAGAAFGGAGGATVFGGSGAGNFLTRLTVISAFVFMITSMTQAWLAINNDVDSLKTLSAQQRLDSEQRQQERNDITKKNDNMPNDNMPNEESQGTPHDPLAPPSVNKNSDPPPSKPSS